MVIIIEYFTSGDFVMAIDFRMEEFLDCRMRLNRLVCTMASCKCKGLLLTTPKCLKTWKSFYNKMAFIDTTCLKRYFSPNGMGRCLYLISPGYHLGSIFIPRETKACVGIAQIWLFDALYLSFRPENW